MAHTLAPPGLGQEKGGLAHALHASGHHDFRAAGLDFLGGGNHRLHSRTTQGINGNAWGTLANSRLEGRLAGGILTLSGLKHISHENLIYLVRRDLGPFQDFLNNDPSQLRGRYIPQGATESPNRGPHHVGDHHISHLFSPIFKFNYPAWDCSSMTIRAISSYCCRRSLT